MSVSLDNASSELKTDVEKYDRNLACTTLGKYKFDIDATIDDALLQKIEQAVDVFLFFKKDTLNPFKRKTHRVLFQKGEANRCSYSDVTSARKKGIGSSSTITLNGNSTWILTKGGSLMEYDVKFIVMHEMMHAVHACAGTLASKIPFAAVDVRYFYSNPEELQTITFLNQVENEFGFERAGHFAPELVFRHFVKIQENEKALSLFRQALNRGLDVGGYLQSAPMGSSLRSLMVASLQNRKTA